MNKLLIVLGVVLISRSYTLIADLESDRSSQQNFDTCGFIKGNATQVKTIEPSRINKAIAGDGAAKAENGKGCNYITIAEAVPPDRGSPDQRGEGGTR